MKNVFGTNMSLLNYYASKIYIYLLLLIISTLISSLIKLILYIHINFPDTYIDFITIIGTFLSFLTLLKLKSTIFSNEIAVFFTDLCAGVIILSPILGLTIFSQLPLGDDIRYLGAGIIIPNGFINLPSSFIISFSRMLNISPLIPYWLLVSLGMYTFTLTLLLLLRKIIPTLSEGNALTSYVYVFIIQYIPSFLTSYLLPILFMDRAKVNDIIFTDLKVGHIGRQAGFDPNLIKNIGILLPLSSFIIVKRDNLIGKFFISLIYMMAFLTHPQNALLSIVFAEFVNAVFKSKQHVREVIISEYLPLAFFSVINYFIIGLCLGFSQISFIFTGEIARNLLLASIINSAIFLGILFLPTIIFIWLSFTMQRKTNGVKMDTKMLSLMTYLKEMVLYLFILFGIVAIIFHNFYLLTIYYPLVIILIALPYIAESGRKHILQFLTFASVIIILSIFSFNLNLAKYFVTATADISRYLSVTVRNLSMPITVISVLFALIYLMHYVSKLKQKRLQRILLLVFLSLSLINATFYMLYWGYYYRNPWANKGAGTASVSNHVLSEVMMLNMSPTPFIHTSGTDRAIMVRDILGLKVGNVILNPTTINDDSLPICIRRIYSFVPDIIIIDETYDVLKGTFSPTKQIELMDGKKVNIYLISDPKTINVKKFAIIGPAPHPGLAPEYYIELLKLQSNHPDIKLLILDSESEAKAFGVNLFGIVNLVGKDEVFNLSLTVTRIKIRELHEYGYEYLYVRLKDKSSKPVVLCGNLSVSEKLFPDIYPSYIDKPLSFLVSVKQIMNVCKHEYVSFLSAEIIPCKGYKIKLFGNLENIDS